MYSQYFSQCTLSPSPIRKLALPSFWCHWHSQPRPLSHFTAISETRWHIHTSATRIFRFRKVSSTQRLQQSSTQLRQQWMVNAVFPYDNAKWGWKCVCEHVRQTSQNTQTCNSGENNSGSDYQVPLAGCLQRWRTCTPQHTFRTCSWCVQPLRRPSAVHAADWWTTEGGVVAVLHHSVSSAQIG